MLSSLAQVVPQLNYSILESFDSVQMQWSVSMASSNQWNSISDEHWRNCDDEFIDCAGVEERCDEVTTTHQPDVLPG